MRRALPVLFTLMLKTNVYVEYIGRYLAPLLTYYDVPNSNFIYYRYIIAITLTLILFNARVRGTARYEVRFSSIVAQQVLLFFFPIGSKFAWRVCGTTHTTSGTREAVL